MDRWVAKLIAAILIFVSNTLAGILPIKVSDWFDRKGDRGKMYLSIANCFGGGVFFGAYLMHMSPEVRLLMEDLFLDEQNITYPIPELMTAVGFFLVLFLDTIISTLVGKKAKKNKIEMTGCFSSNGNFQNGSSHNLSTATQSQTNLTLTDDSGKTVENGKAEGSHMPSEKSLGMQEMQDPDSIDELIARPFIVLVGLSFHFLFEGMSLGLQDSTGGVWTLVIAIMSHELVISFSFGLRIVKLFSVKKVIFIMVGYSSAIPIGIAIGAIIFETAGGSKEVDIMSAYILGLSAGIFIYVAFFEILSGELSHNATLSKIVAVTVGFIFMASMIFVEELAQVPEDDVTTEAPPITVI